MAEGADERIDALEKMLQELKANGPPQSASEPTAAERLAALEQAMADLKGDLQKSAVAEAPTPPEPLPPPPAPPPAPPPPAFDPLPSLAALGVSGQRCAIVFYAYDGIPKVEFLLEAFEDEAVEYNACGCALVAVRRVVAGDKGDMRKAREYEERFPSFNFVDGLEELLDIRRAIGLGGDWLVADSRELYNDPVVTLLEPDGGMRQVLSHQGLSAQNMLGNLMRELHIAVPLADARISKAEAEANRQALHNENVAWSQVLEENEELRQPTRSWFDGFLGDGDSKPLLAGVDTKELPEAIDKYLAEGDDDDETCEEVLGPDGKAAPSWYTKAKRTAEKKQAEEKLLWNGTAPSATPGPFPLGPSGQRLAPMQNYTKKALQEANVKQKQLVSSFFKRYGVEMPLFLTGGDAEEGVGAVGAGGEPLSEAARATRTETTESALMRAEMLALGLSRSATSSQSTRRLRLLRELEASVRELEVEGFRDRAVLGKLKEQIRESYANAPAEFIDEARKADPFNEFTPRLSTVEIAAEFASMAEAGLTNVKKGIERSLITGPDFDSLNPGRKRGPREKGNKIEIQKPNDRDEA